MRGRDIKRYSYDWAELWLIATFPSRHYNIDQYPSVKRYLLSYGMEKLEQTGKTHIVNGEKIKARKKTNNKWFEIQDSISYWEAFNKPVITWQRITRENTFCLTKSGLIILDSMAFISCGNMNILKYLIAILNSNIISFWVNKNVPQYGDKGYRLANQFVEQIPIPPISMNTRIINKITSFVDDMIKDNNESVDIDQLYEKIDLSIHSLYNLATNEITYIQSQLQKE